MGPAGARTRAPFAAAFEEWQKIEDDLSDAIDSMGIAAAQRAFRAADGHVPASDVREPVDLDWLTHVLVGVLFLSAAAFTIAVIALLLAVTT